MSIGKIDLAIMWILAGAVMGAPPALGQTRAPFSYMYTLMMDVVGPAGNSMMERSALRTQGDEDWRRLKQDVVKLVGSTGQIAFGGTTAPEEQRAKSNEWQRWASKLSEAASAAERAIDHRDRAALLAANDRLAESCEGCHMAFPIGVH